MSRLKLAFAVLCFCLLASADDALVLHYRFDEDLGSKAKDLSPCGNDGKIVEAKYLSECNGRRGVLRFDCDRDHIGCPHAESHGFEGDLSLEMWVRTNAPEERIGTALRWGRKFQLHGITSPLVEFATGDHRWRTKLAKRLGGDGSAWAHLAVVVEYPRVRLYRNGELVRDAYMPLRGVMEKSNTTIIGSRCRIDLDEIRVYRRALTATEIAAHAAGEEAPPGKDIELAVEPHWYDEIVTLRLSCKGFDFAGHRAQMTLLAGNRKDVVTPKTAPLVEASAGCRRYVAETAFPLAGLGDRTLDGVARIEAPGGKVVKTVCRHAFLKKPKWVHTRAGHSDGVLPPWTPVEARQGPGDTVEVRVWGRRHVFGRTLFPDEIETRGAKILAAPISLSGEADGKALSPKDARVTLTEGSKSAASLKQTCESGPLSFRVGTTVEFDGYMIFDCEVKARRDMTLNTLMLEIPLRGQHAGLCFGSNVYPEKKDPQIPMSTLHMGAVEGELAFRFSPNVWLGDEERGLTWQAESNEDWRYADPQKAIEVLPRGDTTTFRANWVNVPIKLAAGETLHYKFALQATPVKPLLRDAWDLRILRSDPYTGMKGNLDLNLPDRKIALDHAKVDRIYSLHVDELNLMEDGPNRKPVLEHYADTGVRHVWINVHDNWPWPLPADKQLSRRLRRLINETHAHGLKIYSYLIHERMPTNVPEYDGHGLHMSNLPLRPYMGVVGFCPKSGALRDALAHNFAQRLEQYGDDGVYLDGTGVHMKPCRNLAHGCGYRAKDGAIHAKNAVAFDETDRGADAKAGPIHPTYPVFAERKLLQRLYTAVKLSRPKGVVDVHSWHLNSGGLAYADMLWTGEQWWHYRGKGVKFVAAELTLDVFRTAFTGYQLGVAAETLPYRLLGNNARNSQVAATSLLHDIPVRVRAQDTEYFDIMSRLWKVREQFGMKAAEKLFYWKNADYVRVQPDQCYATLFKHPNNGVLAFISNLSRDAQTVTTQLNLDRLGLRGKALKVINALTNEPVAMTPDGKLSVPLGSEEWVYVWLRPKAKDYQAAPRPTDGANLALTVEKLTKGFDPERPLLIWAIGSSFTQYLGNGDDLIGHIRKRFPGTPEIVYKRMVGGSTPYRLLRGWARHLLVPDQPDVVLIYNFGSTVELEKLVVELRTHTTADIIVPTLHWCRPHQNVWPDPEGANRHQHIAGLRQVCARHRVEFVENRRELTQHMVANGLEISDLLVDTVHQSPHAVKMTIANIARHFHRSTHAGYDPRSRERRIEAETPSSAIAKFGDWRPAKDGQALTAGPRSSIEAKFTGTRIDFIGWRDGQGGSARVWIDGKPASEAPVYYATYVQPAKDNFIVPNSPQVNFRRATSDRCPHAISLGSNIAPQQWTITMTNDEGDYELVGSITGLDGKGSAFKPFTSQSGQIIIEPHMWRLAKTNRTGDRFSFEVRRCAQGRVDFVGAAKKFRTRLVENLPNGPHTLRLEVQGDRPVIVDAFDVFEPPHRER